VAGLDSMLPNLSGAHGPCFVPNLVLLEDNAGHTGVVLAVDNRCDVITGFPESVAPLHLLDI